MPEKELRSYHLITSLEEHANEMLPHIMREIIGKVIKENNETERCFMEHPKRLFR